MTICKTNQDWASIYKCRNLRSNLDCNLFSHIIEISPTASLTDAAAPGKRQRSHAAATSLNQHILWIKHLIARSRATSAFPVRLCGATGAAANPRGRVTRVPHHDPAQPTTRSEKEGKKHPEPRVTGEGGVTNSRAGGD